MAGEEEETQKALPGRVEAALTRARAAAAADRQQKDGRWLALVPLVVGIVFLALLMPRASTPDAIPAPEVDASALSRIAAAEDRTAREAEEKRIATDVLAVGSAFRALKAAEAKDPDGAAEAKSALDQALTHLAPRPGIEEDLLALRAVQTRHFLDALATWERTGETTTELVELGGSFLGHLAEAGWATTAPTRRVFLDDAQRRAAFKLVWNALLGVERRPAFEATLDEQRVMYRLYLERPHEGDTQRPGVLARRTAATTPEACARANADAQRLVELWRVEKIKRLGALDPSYPALYALGIGYYRAGRYDLSAEAFNKWLEAHPDGPYTLRARNFLRAAIAGSGA